MFRFSICSGSSAGYVLVSPYLLCMGNSSRWRGWRFTMTLSARLLQSYLPQISLQEDLVMEICSVDICPYWFKWLKLVLSIYCVDWLQISTNVFEYLFKIVLINPHVLQRIQFDWQPYLKNFVFGPRLPCCELGAAVWLSWRCKHIHSQSWQSCQVTMILCIINCFILYSLTFWNLIVKILTGICICTRVF